MSKTKTSPKQRSERTVSAAESLAAALRIVLRLGLPLRPDMNIPSDLLAIDSVTARSVDPKRRAARVDALQRLLADLLFVYEPIDRKEAANILFGTNGRGKSLTDRRRFAADKLGYNLDHFRKRVEPEIVKQLAWLVERDALQYVRRGYDGEPYAASGMAPIITAQHIAERTDTEREILLSKIWSEVYALRAALLERENLKRPEIREPLPEEEWKGKVAEVHRLSTQSAKRLQVLTKAFEERYGVNIQHGGAGFGLEGLIFMSSDF